MQDIFKLYPHSNCLLCSNSNVTADEYNFQGYTFAAPTPTDLNTYIAKIDYKITRDGNHSLFVRGNLQNDRISHAPQFPGLIPTLTDVVPSKGLAVGYTAILSSTIINNFRRCLWSVAQSGSLRLFPPAQVDVMGHKCLRKSRHGYRHRHHADTRSVAFHCR